MPAFLRPRPLAGRRAPERRRRLPRGGRRWYFPASGERPGPQAPFSLPPRQPPRSALPQSPRRARAAPHPGTAAPKAGAAPSQSNVRGGILGNNRVRRVSESRAIAGRKEEKTDPQASLQGPMRVRMRAVYKKGRLYRVVFPFLLACAQTLDI
nr:uncharacterized protein LOC120361656 isoform X1 [Saimiri boliviensis boliviensis]